MIKTIIVKIVKLYQRTLSPDHGWFKGLYSGGYCKYYPTCSQYLIEAVEKKGALKGVALGFWRVLRCNPWSKGGNDPVV